MLIVGEMMLIDGEEALKDEGKALIVGEWVGNNMLITKELQAHLLLLNLHNVNNVRGKNKHPQWRGLFFP